MKRHTAWNRAVWSCCVLIFVLFALSSKQSKAVSVTPLNSEANNNDISFITTHHIVSRQTQTNTTGPVQGGADSAQHAAAAAGNSIDTGSGGARSTPTSPEGFAKLLSGVFFGGLLTLLSGGAFIVQAWHYFERFGRRGSDKLAVQIAVGVMCVFSVLQTCVIIHRLYKIHVQNFGDFAFPLLTVGWEISVSWVCIAINTSIAQLYYAHRVWLAFNKNKIVLGVYAILITYTFCGGVASAAMIIEAGSAANVKGQALHSFQPNSIPWEFSIVFATWLCSSAAIDVSLCVSLILQLNKMSTPFFHTRHAVARLLLLSVETCLGTTTLSFAAMILFLAVPYQFYFQIPFLPIGQVMSCSLLITLLTRPSIARELARDQVGMPLEGCIEEASHTAPKSLAKPVVKRMMRHERKRRPMGDGIGVHMTMTQEVEADDPTAMANGTMNFETEKAAHADGDSNSTLAPLDDDAKKGIDTNNSHRQRRNSIRDSEDSSLPPVTRTAPFIDNQISNVVGGMQGTNLVALASRGPGGARKKVTYAAPPDASNAADNVHAEQTKRNEPLQQNQQSITSTSTDRTLNHKPSYGRTPRGRIVAVPESLNTPTTSTSTESLERALRAFESEQSSSAND